MIADKLLIWHSAIITHSLGLVERWLLVLSLYIDIHVVIPVSIVELLTTLYN
jgi:hypothetical protein